MPKNKLLNLGTICSRDPFGRIYLLIFILYFFTLDFSNAQSLAWSRANKLHNGINYSYLELTGKGNPGINYMDYLDWSNLSNVKTQMQLMHQLGYETLRLPVAFNNWEDGIPPYTIDSTRYFYAIDSILTWCYVYNMYLVIDYQNGNLYDWNYSSELPRVIQLWKQIATRYATSDPNKLFFEFYNEPYNISDANWRNAADMFIDSIRPIVPNHTFIIGTNNYNILYQFYQMGTLPDTNIIYSFHFYEPMIFTHQGAPFSDPTTSTTNVPFPYDAAKMPPINPLAVQTIGWHPYDYYNYSTQGNCGAVYNSLVLAKNWSQMNNVPIWCGEFGSYNVYAPWDGSRCWYTECVKNNLDQLGIPFALWDWGGWFSIFDGPPSLANLSPCMQQAMDIVQTTTSVTTLDSRKISGASIYPNPSNSFIHTSSNENLNWVIYSNIGIEVMDEKNVSEVNISGLAKGMYIVRFYNEHGEFTSTQKFVKE